jgi:hypothetical protein
VIEISLKPKSPAHSTETQLRFVSRLPVLRFHFPGKSVVCYLCEKTHFASSLLSYLLLLIKSQFSIISSQSKFFTFPSIFSLQRNPVIFSQKGFSGFHFFSIVSSLFASTICNFLDQIQSCILERFEAASQWENTRYWNYYYFLWFCFMVLMLSLLGISEN